MQNKELVDLIAILSPKIINYKHVSCLDVDAQTFICWVAFWYCTIFLNLFPHHVPFPFVYWNIFLDDFFFEVGYAFCCHLTYSPDLCSGAGSTTPTAAGGGSTTVPGTTSGSLGPTGSGFGTDNNNGASVTLNSLAMLVVCFSLSLVVSTLI